MTENSLIPVTFVITSKSDWSGQLHTTKLKARYDQEKSLVVLDGGLSISNKNNIIEMHIELEDGTNYFVDWVDLENGKIGLGVFKDEDVKY